MASASDDVPAALKSGLDHADAASWARLAQCLATTHLPRPSSGFGRVHCEPGWSWQPTFDDYDLWLVLAGRGAARVAGADVAFGPGSLFVLRPGDVAAFSQDPDDRLHVSYCHFRFVDPTGEGSLRLPDDLSPARWQRDVDRARMSARMHRLVSLRRDSHPLRQWEAGGALAAVLAEVYVHDAQQSGRPAPVLDDRIQQVLDFIADNLHRRPLVRETAARVSLSPGRVSKLFVEQMGTSIREYTVAARLERARRLLLDTSMTAGQIATVLGYHDVFLFSRQFKRRYGQAPSRFRAEAAAATSDGAS